ncbi:cupin-like domain-containing protein [Alteromonadaceae bacterium M269]|nr:cupin-like domain-containing protein [Alteromonadaceae bacterium M269]
MILDKVDRVDRLEPREFKTNYLNKKPVVFTGMSQDWPAYKAWSLEYMQEKIGHHTVPLYKTGAFNPRASFNAAHTEMNFADYIQLIQQGPTDLRVFLLNALKLNPDLLNDFSTPDVMDGFLNSFPTLFFGSENAFVFMHYDLDMGHVFHTQFCGSKRVVLFSPENNVQVYQVPFSVRSFMELDADNPDFARFPALKFARGFATTIEHGETLYIPSGWWHQLRYLSVGFGLSQRAMADTWSRRFKAAYNVGVMPAIENIARKTAGESWMNLKNKWALGRGDRYLNRNCS